MPTFTLTPEQVEAIREALTSAVELSKEQDASMSEEPGYYDSEDIREAREYTSRLQETREMFDRITRGGDNE